MFARIVEPRVLPLFDDSSTCLFGSEGGVKPQTSLSNGKTMPSLPVSWEGRGVKGLTAPERRACASLAGTCDVAWRAAHVSHTFMEGMPATEQVRAWLDRPDVLPTRYPYSLLPILPTESTSY